MRVTRKDNNKCTICGGKGIPGLIRGAGKCQYHWDLECYGREWVDKCHPERSTP